MKKVFFLFAFAAMSASAFAQTTNSQTTTATMPAATPAKAVPAANGEGPQIKLDFEIIDYGDIQKGSDGNREFTFSNPGTKPLEITNAQGSCGCTVPTWPHEPIAPKGKNSIKVKYDTNREGPFTKYVTLTTNVPGQETIKLTIKGNVLKGADAAAPATAPANH